MEMLVYDLEKLLAQYEERQVDGKPELYDTVSGVPFFQFSGHMDAIQKRLPNVWRQTYVSS